MHIVHLKANRALPSCSIIKYSKQDLLITLTNLLRLIEQINMGSGTIVTSMVLILLITSWWEAFVITPSSLSYSALKHSFDAIWKQLHFTPHFYHFYRTQIWILNQYAMLILMLIDVRWRSWPSNYCACVHAFLLFRWRLTRCYNQPHCRLLWNWQNEEKCK